MAHRRHRDRNYSVNTRIQIETIPENRELKHSLDLGFRNIPNRGFRFTGISPRPSDFHDNSRMKDGRNLGSRTLRNSTQQERILRREPEKLTALEKLRHFNAKDWSYDLPRDHPICQKRKERKEILFATGKAGKSGQKPLKLPRINIRCK